MKKKPARELRNRRGTIAVLTALMMTAILGMAAFSVDYGCILTARTDLQAAADAAALAAVRELLPDANGCQYYSVYTTCQKVREYANANISGDEWFHIPYADIEIGRYDPSTVYSGGPLTLLHDGVLDTVRVTLRRDGVNNDKVSLFFARVLGADVANVQATATAILPPVKVLKPGDGILPFAVDITEWDKIGTGDQLNIFDDHMEDADGNTVPGNWCTVDIGDDNNSTDDIGDQIGEGLRQSDLDALASSTTLIDGQTRIPDSSELAAPLWVDAETGLSTSLRVPLQEIMGVPKIIPLFETVYGTGDAAEYRIVSWGVVIITDVDLLGALSQRHVTLQRCYTYNGTLTAASDLSDTDNIQGAFAAAMLVE